MHLRCMLASLALITSIHVSQTIAHPLPTALADIITAPHPHSKRTNYVTLRGLTLRNSQPLFFILPIQLAASQFELFYSTLYARALNALSSNSLFSPSFSLRYETFEISFVSSSADVPWEFVRDFATMMRVLSLRGYTGCYDQGYWDEGGVFGIYVGLRILG